jgi:hypothetical protein
VTVCNYNDGRKDGVETRTYRNDKTSFVTWVQVRKTGCLRIVSPNGDFFVRNYANGELDPSDPGTYQRKNGTTYRGQPSATTLAMWHGVGSTWSILGKFLKAMETKSVLGDIILSPITLTGTALLLSVSTVATGVGLAATPVTGVVDTVKRQIQRASP